MDPEKQSGQGPQNESTNKIKAPEDWVTRDEPMTGAQQSYLNTLASEAGEQPDEELTKAEASRKIEELQHKTGRGLERNGQQETESERARKNEDEGIRGGQSAV